MSEYQYYEFRAVDRPLTPEEQRQVRELSSRASINATRFVNVYHYGDFRGDTTQVLLQLYDAFLYEANWGTHELTLRFPASAVDPQVLAEYQIDEGLHIIRRETHVAVDFLSQDEAPPRNGDNPTRLPLSFTNLTLHLPVKLANRKIRACTSQSAVTP